MTAGVHAAQGAAEEHHAQYAGFSLRFAAGFVDFLVFLPLIGLGAWAMDAGPGEALAYSFLSQIAYFAYTIVGHARWGQTLGKRAVGIRVIDASGRPIGWNKAIRRSTVVIVDRPVRAAASPA